MHGFAGSRCVSFVAVTSVLVLSSSSVRPVDVPCSPALISVLSDTSRWDDASRSNTSLGWCDCIVDSSRGATPLHEIAARANVVGGKLHFGIETALVHRLVRDGARVLAPNRRNSTALHVAAVRGAVAVAVALCDAAANRGLLTALLQAKDASGFTAIVLAESMGHTAVARVLIDRAKGVEGTAPVVGDTFLSGDCPRPVLDAVLVGDAARLREAIISSADGNTGGGNADCLVPGNAVGSSLLHYAVSSMEMQAPTVGVGIIRVLLDFDANASRRNLVGETPLVEAVRTDQAVIAAELLKARSLSSSAVDVRGRTPLHVAALRGSLSCARLLLEHGVSLDARDNQGMTPQDLAERGGHFEVARLLAIAALDPLGYYSGAGALQKVNSSANFEAGARSEPKVSEDAEGSASTSADGFDSLGVILVAAACFLCFGWLIFIAFEIIYPGWCRRSGFHVYSARTSITACPSENSQSVAAGDGDAVEGQQLEQETATHIKRSRTLLESWMSEKECLRMSMPGKAEESDPERSTVVIGARKGGRQISGIDAC